MKSSVNIKELSLICDNIVGPGKKVLYIQVVSFYSRC